MPGTADRPSERLDPDLDVSIAQDLVLTRSRLVRWLEAAVFADDARVPF